MNADLEAKARGILQLYEHPRAAMLPLLWLVQEIRAVAGGCGDPVLQKCAVFLQEMLGVPLDMNVILHVHAPYSFDLSDDVWGLLSQRLLVLRALWAESRSAEWHDAILTLATHPENRVRRGVTAHLYRAATEADRPVLTALAADPDRSVALDASFALKQLDERR